MWIFQLYSDFQQNLQDPIACQEKELGELEKRLGFSGYMDFSSRYRSSAYEDIPKPFREDAEFFVRSSGTNSSAKFIPISQTYLEGNHYKASRYALYNLIFHFRQLQVLSGANLTLTGYKYPDPFEGREVYDISALMFEKRPAIFKPISIPRKIFFSWEEKLSYLLEHAEEVCKIRSISGVPTWMFSMFNAFERHFNRPTHELFPHLKLIVHGGVDFTNYFRQFEATFPDRELTFFENYNATEGFYGFQFTPDTKEMLLCTNCGIFFEFMEQDGTIKPMWEAEVGKIYELLISNFDGLIRYQTGDLIKLHSLIPPLFSFAGRSSEFINAFGEDLLVSQTEKAIKRLNEAFGLNITDYLAFPVYGSAKSMGYHQWILFVDHINPEPENWAKALDVHLQELNNNYNQKREKSAALQPLRIQILSRDRLDDIIHKAGKQVGGQSKLKKLYNSPEKILPLITTYYEQGD